MTDDEINVAIAEACGWTEIGECTCGFQLKGYPPEYSAHGKHILKYCECLNAMHEAERVLNTDELFEKYYLKLYDTTQSTRWPVCATARQRAEAFLRTLGRWKE